MENIFDDLRTARRIWNCDETGFQMMPGNRGVFIWQEKGAKRAKQCYTGGKMMITVMVCGSAAGDLMKPFVIYPGSEASVKRGIGFDFDKYPGASFHATETGWMSRPLFTEFLDHFHHEAERMKIKRPILLILDGAVMHIHTGAIERARAHNIELFLLPPNATSAMQPMDIAVMKPIKDAWRALKTVHSYQHLGPEGVISKKNFLSILKPTLEKGASADNIRAGFRKAGIYPLNAEQPKSNKEMFLAQDDLTTIEDARVLQDIRQLKQGPQYISYGELPARFVRPSDHPQKEIVAVYVTMEYHEEGQPKDVLRRALSQEEYSSFVTSRYHHGVEYRIVPSSIPRLDDNKRCIVRRVKVQIQFKTGDLKVTVYTPQEWMAATGSVHEVSSLSLFFEF